MARMGSKRSERRVRRQFSEEFIAGAVRLVLDEGKTIGAVARELDLTPSSLANWVRHARAERTQGKISDATQTRHSRHRIRDESEVDFAVRDLASFAAVAQGIATALTLSLGAIGSVSLPVGGASAS